jgi:hypothetical protein
MALGITRKRRASFSGEQVVPIVGDGAIATKSIGEGRIVPLIIFDEEARPDLAELVRIQQESEPGDADSQWGAVENAKNAVALIVKFRRPMEITAVFQFDLNKYDGFVDQIISAKTVYLQGGRPGVRLKHNLNAPKMFVEIPDTGFRPFWDNIFYRNAVRRMREGGLNRQQAKQAARQYIEGWRKFGATRVGNP